MENAFEFLDGPVRRVAAADSHVAFSQPLEDFICRAPTKSWTRFAAWRRTDMAIDVTMPQMGESVVEGTITKWLVKEGDVVIEDSRWLRFQPTRWTPKFRRRGRDGIAKLVAAEGQTLPVGATLAVIEPAGAEAPAKLKVVAPKAAPKPEPAPAQVKPAPPPAAPSPSPQPIQAAGAGLREAEPDAGAPRRFSPVVLKIAAEEASISVTYRELELADVSANATCNATSIRCARAGRRACRAAADQWSCAEQLAPCADRCRGDASAGANRSGVQASRLSAHRGRRRRAVQRRRKLIAEHMVYSKTHSPHVGTVAEVDVSNAMRLREKHKTEFARREGFNLTFLPLAAAATVRALKEFPRMNASVVGDSVVTRREINLGIAMDTDEGLLVPVIKAAEGMSGGGNCASDRNSAPQSRREEDHRRRSRGRQFSRSRIPDARAISTASRSSNQPQVGILRMAR